MLARRMTPLPEAVVGGPSGIRINADNQYNGSGRLRSATL